jgi:DNA polymerase-3 subunit gamma/tau
MRDALSIMDQAIASSEGKLTKDAVLALVGVAPGEVLEAIMQAIENNSSEEVLRTVDRLMAEGQSPVHFSRQMIRFLRNAIVAKVAGGESQLLQISADERARVARVAERFSEEDLTRFLQILLRAYNDISYRADQRFHLELALLKLVHAQRLLPVEELLSGMQSQAGRSVKPSPRPAATPSTSSGAAAGSQSVAPAVPRSEVSPFEKDRARKNEMSAAPVAVMEATAEPQNSPANDFELVTRVSSAVIAALEDQGHRQLAAILAGGNWEVAGAEAIVRVATPASLLELALSTEAKKIAASAASTAAARNLRLRAEAVAATNGSATSNQPMRHSAGAPAGGRQRAIDDPLVRKVQEKFGAEIRTVIDYREKQRPKS